MYACVCPNISGQTRFNDTLSMKMISFIEYLKSKLDIICHGVKLCAKKSHRQGSEQFKQLRTLRETKKMAYFRKLKILFKIIIWL